MDTVSMPASMPRSMIVRTRPLRRREGSLPLTSSSAFSPTPTRSRRRCRCTVRERRLSCFERPPSVRRAPWWHVQLASEGLQGEQRARPDLEETLGQQYTRFLGALRFVMPKLGVGQADAQFPGFSQQGREDHLGSARDVRTTLANISAWVRNWSVNAWLAPGIRGTSSASSEISGIYKRRSRSNNRLARLRRRACGRTP